MPDLLRTLSIIFITIISLQCTPLYQPNSIMVPKLENKGDVEFQGSVKLNGDLNVNTAYALSDNDAIVLNAGHLNYSYGRIPSPNSGSFGETETEAKSRFGALGYGRYFSNDKKCYSYFGGAGYGSHASTLDDISTDRQMSEGTIKGDFIKVFSQYGVRYSTGRNVDFEWFGRLSYVHTFNIEKEGMDYWQDKRMKNAFPMDFGLSLVFRITNSFELFGQFAFSINPVGIQQLGDDLWYQSTEFSSIGCVKA